MTNLLIKLLTGTTPQQAKQKAEQETVCNYSNNYYGDQVCTLKK